MSRAATGTGTGTDERPDTGTKAGFGPGGESRKTAWGFTGLVALLYVINWADKAVYGLVAQPLKDEIGLSNADIGLIGSAFFLTFIVGNLCAGAINRSMTLRWSLAALAIGWSIAMMPIVLSATFTVLLLSRMLLGLLEGPSSPLVHTAIYSWHPIEKRGLPSAVITTSASVAKLVLAPGLALIVSTFGWRAAFLTLAGAGLAWLFCWLPIWRPGPYGGENSSAADDVDDEPRVPWVKVLTSKTFIGGALCSMTVYALVSVILTWLPSYFEKGLDFPRTQAGAMFGAPSLVSIFLLYATTYFSDRMIARGASSRLLRGIVPTIGAVICGISLLVLPVFSNAYAAVVVVSVGYALGVTILPLYNAGLSEIVPPRQFAATLGVFLAVQSLGGVYGPYIAGLVVDSAGEETGYGLAFQIFGAMILLGAILALFLVNPDRDKVKLRPTVFAS